ncbi:aspartate kinase [Streptococcus dysgalactiae subsp. equisimilis]|uniref:Aspartate kinase n=7 Tax=Streptococcus TaxID=1301 RepID=A0A9X8T6Y5_STREQ|nr:aspartate kinase [Streptococcus dysgalactiae subsp. equisimilis]
MKVVKFGGSSLASAQQLKKVLAIVKEDKNRKVVVVSAPGKRTPDDTKVTDALIAYYKAYKSGKDFQEPLNWISQRYQTICQDLGIDSQVGTDITQSLEALAKLPIDHNPFLYDTFLAAGEDNNAKLIAAYFQASGLTATYLHPKDVGLFVSQEPQNARVLPVSYDHIEKLNQLEGI